MVKKIIPNLWFDHQAEEAARFYVSIFPNSSLGTITHYSNEVAAVAGRPSGSVLTVDFTLDGNPFVALNGGPLFQFNESISFIVDCDTQEEIDHYWSKLTAEGGAESQCGWLKDKYGVSWQIVPSVLEQWVREGDSPSSRRAIAAMLQMSKLDIEALTRAYEG